MMSTDTSPWPQKDAGTRTHSPTYLNEEILASDGVLRDWGHLLGREAVHGVDHLAEQKEVWIRVFVVPIEGAGRCCQTLLPPRDRGVQTDHATAIRPAGSPISTQLPRPLRR